MKKMKIARIAGLALSSMVLALAGCSNAAEDKKPGVAKPALTVTTAQASMASLPLKLGANGNIAAWQEAIVGSESNGLRLAEVRVNVGDTVKAGQVLAVFAPEAVQADVAAARAALAEAEANAADAGNNAARARTLQDSGALSTQQINQYLTGEQTARARVDSARASLAAQQLRLKNTQLTAPDSGVISARNATVGAVVGSGTELFRMIRKGRLEWRAEVTSTELSRIRPGATALVTVANGSQLKGVVRTIGPTVNPQTRVALVYVDLPGGVPSGGVPSGGVPSGAPPSGEPKALALAGMFAHGEFELGASPALTVPQQAVVVRDGFSYVFRLNSDSRVSQHKVRAGRRMGDRIEILEGVAPEAQLVVSGAGFLNDGDLVKNVAATAPAAAAK